MVKIVGWYKTGSVVYIKENKSCKIKEKVVGTHSPQLYLLSFNSDIGAFLVSN